MSVVGIDLGAQSTKIGVARNKGIDIVCTAPRLPNLAGSSIPLDCDPGENRNEELRLTMNVLCLTDHQ